MGLLAMHARLLLCLSLAGCPDSPQLGETQYPITDGGIDVDPPKVDHAAAILKGTTSSNAVPICSGTRISDGWVLTARRCDVKVDGTYFIGIYDDSNGFDSVHPIVSVVHPAGTSATDWINSNGAFADITLVHTSAPALGVEPPLLAWKHTSGNTATKVGNGQHDGIPNANGRLLVNTDTPFPLATDGSFLTGDGHIESGDAGGPVYLGLPDATPSVVLGVASSRYGRGDSRDRYTSVARHLAFILNTIGWTWSGSSPAPLKRVTGELSREDLIETQIGCQYACETSTSCVAYNYSPTTKQCQQYWEMDSTVTATGWMAAWFWL